MISVLLGLTPLLQVRGAADGGASETRLSMAFLQGSLLTYLHWLPHGRPPL